MNITVNKSTVRTLLNDEVSNREIIDFLNEIIDTEIEKDEPDCDLIDDCINAIDEIQLNSNLQPTLRLVLTKKQVLNYCRHHSKNNNAVKAVVAACMVIIISGVTVLNTSPALAEEVKSFFATVISALQTASEETENGNKAISSIYATMPDDTPLKVSSIDEVDISKIKVTAVYDDASEHDVEIKNCSVTKTTEHTDKGSFVLVTISYDGCACTIAFELEGVE